MAKRWYVVHAYSGFEAQVKKSIEDRFRERSEYADKIGDILIPTEEVVEMKSGKKKRSERKFYPGYVLVQIDMDDELWHFIRRIPRVLGFIGGTSDRPTPISDKEAENILQRIQAGADKPRPKVLFEPGEVIRVTDGPFADFNGSVEEVNYEKSRLKVAVLIFGRSTPVDLDFNQVEKA
jgi:transcription termination/antitermination protein NusG